MPKQTQALLGKPGINSEQLLQCRQSVRKRDTQKQPRSAQPEAGMRWRRNQKQDPHWAVATLTLLPLQLQPCRTSGARQDQAQEKCISAQESFPPWPEPPQTLMEKGKEVFWQPVRLPQMDLPGWHRLDQGGIFRGFNFSARVLLHGSIHGHCSRRFPIC